MRLVILFSLCIGCFGQVREAASFGIDCSGKVDNSPTWQRLVDSAGDDAAFSLPSGCTDMHATTVTVSSRASFKLMSYDRAQNGGGNRRPMELWTGTIGGMWDFPANQAPTIEGFLFMNTTPVDYYLRFGGSPATRIGTEALIRYNTFTNTLNDPNFSAVSFVPHGNGEKNVITDNDFFCSQSRAVRKSDLGQIIAGSHTLTCGLLSCSFLVDAKVGNRVRVSYATGILDTTIAATMDDNHLEMTDAALSTQSNARIHFGQAYGNGIFIGSSPNCKHNTIERNSFTQCACGLRILNGSFSSQHFGGSANDTLACINNISEPSELAYLEDENSLRDVYADNLDAPLTISHARNSIYNAESDGFLLFDRSVRVTISGSTVQSTPISNSVLIRATAPSQVVLMSIGNLWGPGVVDEKHLGFSQWNGFHSTQGALISCGDFGMADQNGSWTLPITCGIWVH